jgi:lysophospholipase L1-like esterase
MDKIQNNATAPVTLMVVPHLDYTDSTYQRTDEHRLVEEEPARHGVSTVDVLDTFLTKPVTQVRQDQMHPNANGHQLMAEVAYRWLVETIAMPKDSASKETPSPQMQEGPQEQD